MCSSAVRDGPFVGLSANVRKCLALKSSEHAARRALDAPVCVCVFVLMTYNWSFATRHGRGAGFVSYCINACCIKCLHRRKCLYWTSRNWRFCASDQYINNNLHINLIYYAPDFDFDFVLIS